MTQQKGKKEMTTKEIEAYNRGKEAFYIWMDGDCEENPPKNPYKNPTLRHEWEEGWCDAEAGL